MDRCRPWCAGTCATLVFVLVLGCGDEERPKAPAPSVTGGSGGTGGSPAGAGGEGGEGGVSGGAGSGAGTTGFSIIDEPTTPCAPLGASALTLYESAMPGLSQVTPVGDRWAAGTQYYAGFVLFDGTGQNASQELTRLGVYDRISGNSTGLSVGAISKDGAVYGRYDAQGSVVGSISELATGSVSDMYVARSAESALVVFLTLDGPLARPISDTGEPGPGFDLEPNLDVKRFSAAISEAGPGRFAIAWSASRVSDGLFRSFVLFATASGQTGAPRPIHQGIADQGTLGIVPTSLGFAVAQMLDGATLVVPLNENGLVSGPARRLQGTVETFGIATHDDQLVVVAARDDGRDAFRALNLDGEPTGDWVCLNEASAGREKAAAIGADSQGFVILFRDETDSQMFVRITDPRQGI